MTNPKRMRSIMLERPPAVINTRHHLPNLPETKFVARAMTTRMAKTAVSAINQILALPPLRKLNAAPSF